MSGLSGQYPLVDLLECAGLARSSYYYALSHPKAPTRPELWEAAAEIFSRTANGCGHRQIAMCPYCGTSEEDFRACGLVGCAQCYQSLSKAVIPVVIRLQGTETHCGKKPRNSGEREEMVRRRNLLKTRVEELIKNRSYEAAKMCSDELKRLNKILYKEGPDD